VTRYLDAVQRAFGIADVDKQDTSVVLLYVCRANSARSQMAEAWSRVLLPQKVQSASCGIEVRPIHPLTIAAMAEVGVDLSRAQTTVLSAVAVRPTVVVSVCDSARSVAAQSYIDAEHLHWSIPDPAARAEINVFRHARDAIRERVVDLSTRYAQP
jgi:ArsR family transcriptional regulator